MKKSLNWAILSLILLLPNGAHAFNNQPIFDTTVAYNSGNVLWRLATTTPSEVISAITLNLYSTSTPNVPVSVRFTCLDNTFSNTQFTCANVNPIVSPTLNVIGATPAQYTFDFATSSLTLQNNRAYIVEVIPTNFGDKVSVNGKNTVDFATQCLYPNISGSQFCTGTPFSIFNNSATSSVATRFLSLSPVDNFTVATTSVNFFIEYFYNSSTENFNEIGYEVFRADNNFSFETRQFFTIFDGQNAVSTSFTFNPNGAYSWRAFMRDSNTGNTIFSPFQTFYTLSNPYPALIGASTTNTFNLATSTCGVFNITGCFQNALEFVFYPSPDVLNLFTGLQSDLSKKPPFGYVSVSISQLAGLSATGSSTFALVLEPTIDNSIIQPMKTATASILFLFFGVWFYNRVRKIDI